MICKHCGKESATTDRCSLCGQELTAAREPEERSTSAAAPDQPGSATPLSALSEAPGPQSATGSGSQTPVRKQRPPAPAIVPRSAGRSPTPPLPTASSNRAAFLDLTTNLSANPPTGELTEALPASALSGGDRPAVPSSGVVLNSDAGPIGSSPVSPTIGASAPVGKEAPPARQVAHQPAIRRSRTRSGDEDTTRRVGEPRASTLIVRFVGVYLLILVVTGLVTFFARNYSAVPLIIAMFLGGLLLPIMRVVPWADEDSGDLVLFSLLMLMFGPIVGLVIYVLLGLIRQDANPALVGCFIVAALARIVVQSVVGHPSIMETMPFAQIGEPTLGIHLIARLLLDWSGLLALAGWFTAGSFRKFDE